MYVWKCEWTSNIVECVYHLIFQNYDEILIYRRKAILLLGSISLNMYINQEWIEVSDLSVQSPLYIWGFHIHKFNQLDQIYTGKKNPKSYKIRSLNLLVTNNYFHSIHIVLGILSNLYMMYYIQILYHLI